MGILESIYRAITVPNINEERLYEMVYEELSNNEIRAGLWTKAISESYGDVNVTKSLYIKYRVKSLKDELVAYEDEQWEQQKRIEEHNRNKEHSERLRLEGNAKAIEERNTREIIRRQKELQDNQKADNEALIVYGLTVYDNLTGRTWIRDGNILNKISDFEVSYRKDNGAKLRWEDAKLFAKYMNKRNYANYSDWRLPTKDEIIKLTRFGGAKALNNLAFNCIDEANYWTSTKHDRSPNSAWCFGMYSKELGCYEYNDKLNVLLVR